MIWSRYNTMFKSRDGAGFVYNSLSNSLIELDESHFHYLAEAKESGVAQPQDDEVLHALLRSSLALVEPGEEDNQLLERQYQRRVACFDASTLALTICPTLLCNFRCPYCFETSQMDGGIMTPATRERLVAWVTEQQGTRQLSATWFGGEPLLAFDTISELTDKFMGLGLDYCRAGLVTNGYLLDKAKIAKLNELKISSIQITLDGPRQTHDRRRFLAGGKPTFDRILDNIGELMASDYTGACNIRVNVDKDNFDKFIELDKELLEKFKGGNFHVYPALVDASPGRSRDYPCLLEADDWADFNLDLYWRHSIIPFGGFHPGNGIASGMCVATRHNAFVVGPAGELYKCWDNVGDPAMVVGDIHAKDTITNPSLRAQYAIGTDAYADPECRGCQSLPICGGGCANQRLRAKSSDGGRAACSLLKNRLTDFLEAYVDTFSSKEILDALLAQDVVKLNARGYRSISPVATQSLGNEH